MADLIVDRLIAKMELMFDMKRAAFDCSRDYYTDGGDAVYAILQSLREIYPSTTDDEMVMVLEAAEAELRAEVTRLRCWDHTHEDPAIEAWVEQAKSRIFDLEETRINLE